MLSNLPICFNLLDIESCGTIFISSASLIAFLMNIEVQTVKNLFNDFDTGHNGSLDIEEFKPFILACFDKDKSRKAKKENQEREFIHI